MDNTETIQFIGVKDLDDMEKDIVNKLSSEYHEKFHRKLKNDVSMVVHVKTYRNEGNRHKFSIGVRVNGPTRVFESSKTADWDIARTLHKSFKDVERQIEHKLHTDDQHNKVKTTESPL